MCSSLFALSMQHLDLFSFFLVKKQQQNLDICVCFIICTTPRTSSVFHTKLTPSCVFHSLYSMPSPSSVFHYTHTLLHSLQLSGGFSCATLRPPTVSLFIHHNLLLPVCYCVTGIPVSVWHFFILYKIKNGNILNDTESISSQIICMPFDW